MPGMDGYEVCRHLKNDERLKEIPVIYLSALTGTKDKVKAFEQGGVDYIEKPFQLEEVRARVDMHLKFHDFQKKLATSNKNLNQVVEEKIKEISESQMATIFALAKLAEFRDDDTGTHLERVQKFCKLLAMHICNDSSCSTSVDAAFVENIYHASPLHDIGKVGISDAILLKPGKLTLEEFELMKQHTVLGAQTLETARNQYPRNAFINMGIDVARSHHERWDGTGYPDGLTGIEIPLSARIMAVADVYDALRSKRCYKEAFTHETSRDIILQGRGTQFDPAVVDAFIALEHKFNSVRTAMDQE